MAQSIPSVHDSLKEAIHLFKEEYSKVPDVAVFAPGRVNLIGEHTDYNDGFVLPMALPLITVIVGCVNGTNEVQVYTANKDVDKPHKIKFLLGPKISLGAPKWANYVKGIILQYKEAIIPGFDAVIVCSLPVGGGLSSSAAIEVATLTFLEALTGKTMPSIQKALNCQKVEHEYAGVPCGIMDQLVSVSGQDNTALLIDCRSLEITYVPFEDPDVVILISDSNVKHELSSGEYAVRKAQCQEVAKLLMKKSLREVTEEDLLKLENAGTEKTLIARGRHVVTEIKRTEEGAKALLEKDFKKFGKLMVESHESLRYDYEVSCKELDEMVEAALKVDGVYGSRMTGGGFGGCTVTLLRRESIHECIDSIKKNYSGNPIFYVCKAAGGAKQLALSKNVLES